MDVRIVLLRTLRELGFETDEIKDATLIREDLEVDSTELVEIAVAVERHLPISLDSTDFEALRTFGDMVTFVESAPMR